MASFERLERWIYVSEALLEIQDAEVVADIVQVSRARNSDLNVTGALVFAGGRFAQLIEGPSGSIADLKASILGDDRHHRVTTLVAGPQERRLFIGWALVYSGGSRYIANFLHGVQLGIGQQKHADQEAIFEIFETFAAHPESPGGIHAW